MGLIERMKELSFPGVCVLKIGDDRVSIIESSNMLNSIVTILGSIPKEGKILEYRIERYEVLRKILYSNIYKKYKKWGVQISNKRIPKWDVRIRVGKFLKGNKVFVEYYNTYNSLVLGVFSSLHEARVWKGRYVSSNVVMANNGLTRAWYQKR